MAFGSLPALWLASQALAAEGTFALQPASLLNSCTRVQAVLEVSGQLKVNPDGKKVAQMPITAKGEYEFVEKVTAVDTGSTEEAEPVTRGMRYYRTGTAQSRIAEHEVTNRIDDTHRLIGVSAGRSDVTLYSPHGPLTSDELELLELPANTLLLGRLLPGRETAVGETWKHDDGLAAALFNLDVVTDNKLESKFVRTEAQVAFVELEGAVEGSVAGVESRLKVAAKYQFDLASQRITWLALSVQENRAVGHAEPGFDVTARLRVTLAPGEEIPELSETALSAVPGAPGTGLLLLAFQSKESGFRFLHDRNWKVMVDRHDVTILRLVERGELIAQCNISRMPDGAPDKQLTVGSFQADIRRVLDKNFGQFVDASEAKSEQGVRILRTIVAGVAADLPIQWNYYHLTDSQGHQASLVFTMDAKLVERFGATDQALIASFDFTSPNGKAPATPTNKTAAGKTATSGPTR
ncbi:MAG: hypothetical protein AB7O38_07970 [Pirellulaceae bacterium]